MNKIALVFPGQGSQYIGMGKKLCERYEIAQQTFREASDALGFDLKKMCFEGNTEELVKTENAQPAILTASVAAFRVYMQELGIAPDFCAGHSLGEFSALACSGVIDFQDAVRIVRNRGRFMQEAAALGIGTMAAVSGVEKRVIEEECKKVSADESIVVISNYNSPDQIVISGHKDAVSKVSENLTGFGARVIPLKVSAPFHSPLMQPAADRLKDELLKYSYNSFKWPVLANISARPYEGTDKVVENLTIQMTQPVQWQGSMEYLQEKGINIVIELGPNTVLRNLMKKNAPGIKAFSFDKDEDVKGVNDILNSKTEISSVAKDGSVNAFKHTVVTKCLAIAICTRNRNWDNDEYQKGVIEPYRKIVELQEQLEKENRKPLKEEMAEALEMLKSVFNTKKVPYSEQVERFNQVFEETGTKQLFSEFKF